MGTAPQSGRTPSRDAGIPLRVRSSTHPSRQIVMYLWSFRAPAAQPDGKTQVRHASSLRPGRVFDRGPRTPAASAPGSAAQVGGADTASADRWDTPVRPPLVWTGPPVGRAPVSGHLPGRGAGRRASCAEDRTVVARRHHSGSAGQVRRCPAQWSMSQGEPSCPQPEVTPPHRRAARERLHPGRRAAGDRYRVVGAEQAGAAGVRRGVNASGSDLAGVAPEGSATRPAAIGRAAPGSGGRGPRPSQRRSCSGRPTLPDRT